MFNYFSICSATQFCICAYLKDKSSENDFPFKSVSVTLLWVLKWCLKETLFSPSLAIFYKNVSYFHIRAWDFFWCHHVKTLPGVFMCSWAVRCWPFIFGLLFLYVLSKKIRWIWRFHRKYTGSLVFSQL